MPQPASLDALRARIRDHYLAPEDTVVPGLVALAGLGRRGNSRSRKKRGASKSARNLLSRDPRCGAPGRVPAVVSTKVTQGQKIVPFLLLA